VEARSTEILGIASESVGANAVVTALTAARGPRESDGTRYLESAIARGDIGVSHDIQEAFTLAVRASDDAGITADETPGSSRSAAGAARIRATSSAGSAVVRDSAGS
jgi:hypothetical protein